MRLHLTKSNNRGFTIIELMIATTVLSVILLLVTVMMISIGNLFYKGVNQARVQDDVRNITDEISQHLQLSATTPLPGTDIANPNIGVYCVGDTRYSYAKNVQIGHQLGGSGLSYSHVLWRDLPSGGCVATQGANLQNPNLRGGAELIAPNSRLTDFSISIASPYTISVSVAYGDDDLLCDTGTPGDCSSTVQSTHLLSPVGQINCKSTSGDQFCATASLTTTVSNRLSYNKEYHGYAYALAEN
jgi:prepilin-type N-terminal cleavage/methylation domain-containing protein